jgi:hypothetical protein
LAIKYGAPGNGTSMKYTTNSAGKHHSYIIAANAGYNYDIVGIVQG